MAERLPTGGPERRAFRSQGLLSFGQTCSSAVALTPAEQFRLSLTPVMAAPPHRMPRYLHANALLIALLCWVLSAGLLAWAWADVRPRLVAQQELVEPVPHTRTVRGTGPAVRASAPSLSTQLDRWLDVWLLPLGKTAFAALVGLFGAACSARAYQSRYAPDFAAWIAAGRPVAPVFAFEQGQLRLLRPYPFAASQLAGRTTVTAIELTEVSETGDYLVLAGREKLFFPREQQPTVRAFAAQYGLPRRHRAPVWEWLGAPLDITCDAPARAHEAELLAAGLTPSEIQQARRTLRVGWWINLHWLEGDEMGWSLHDYDHEEILYLTACSLLPRRGWYWRTMALALREAPEREAKQPA
jgi:hypothetical protein